MSADTLLAAHRRLRGHLVATPVIGDLQLPTLAAEPGLRLKAEVLQPGGSLWYRGAVHWLSRQLGRLPGLRVDGDAEGSAAALAWAAAARHLRVAVELVGGGAWSDDARAQWAALAPPAHDPDSGSRCAVTPACDDADFALGVATVAVDLRDELPRDTELLVVAPAALTAAVAEGVRALGLSWSVRPAPLPQAADGAIAADLARFHHLCAGVAGAAAVRAAAVAMATDSSACAVLGE